MCGPALRLPGADWDGRENTAGTAERCARILLEVNCELENRGIDFRTIVQDEHYVIRFENDAHFSHLPSNRSERAHHLSFYILLIYS